MKNAVMFFLEMGSEKWGRQNCCADFLFMPGPGVLWTRPSHVENHRITETRPRLCKHFVRWACFCDRISKKNITAAMRWVHPKDTSKCNPNLKVPDRKLSQNLQERPEN